MGTCQGILSSCKGDDQPKKTKTDVEQARRDNDDLRQKGAQADAYESYGHEDHSGKLVEKSMVIMQNGAKYTG